MAFVGFSLYFSSPFLTYYSFSLSSRRLFVDPLRVHLTSASLVQLSFSNSPFSLANCSSRRDYTATLFLSPSFFTTTSTVSLIFFRQWLSLVSTQRTALSHPRHFAANSFFTLCYMYEVAFMLCVYFVRLLVRSNMCSSITYDHRTRHGNNDLEKQR